MKLYMTQNIKLCLWSRTVMFCVWLTRQNKAGRKMESGTSRHDVVYVLSDVQASVHDSLTRRIHRTYLPWSFDLNFRNTFREKNGLQLIPTHISIRRFSGSDAHYTARQFLDLCEAAVLNSSITEDHNKIAFIRSRLLPGSRTLLMMQSSAFTHTGIGTNYDAFKKNFINFFFGGRKQNKHCQTDCTHSGNPTKKKCIHKDHLGRHGWGKSVSNWLHKKS